MKNNSVIICVAPNGARKSKQDHSAIPISPEELATEAENCLRAGASMIHLHVRDPQGKHSIEPAYYRPAIAAIRARVGHDLIIQATTEAVGMYTPEQQMAAVRELKPEAVSVALKELCPEGREQQAGEFFRWLLQNKIAPQYILYSVEDIERFIKLHRQGVIPDACPSLLLVLGRYSENQTSDPDDLKPMLAALDEFESVWAVCAFGAKEAECVLLAAMHGGHCRIGFENNMLLPNGAKAPNNAALVTNFVSNLGKLGRNRATSADSREILGMK
ncbi:MAG: 3-keto-5-aminohexanoate cleavage protein [Gammaproteobacteria bacterium]|nr:3-keto-5-aminohexanoate cleavage protein [Gammaproteobacteria bacterium]